jgi:hypothetical protein
VYFTSSRTQPRAHLSPAQLDLLVVLACALLYAMDSRTQTRCELDALSHTIRIGSQLCERLCSQIVCHFIKRSVENEPETNHYSCVRCSTYRATILKALSRILLCVSASISQQTGLPSRQAASAIPRAIVLQVLGPQVLEGRTHVFLVSNRLSSTAVGFEGHLCCGFVYYSANCWPQ